jgi:hypothetical protein
MSLRDFRAFHFAKTLALGGMIFYAVLVPWHTVSQATAGIGEPEGARMQPPCHEAAAQPGAPLKSSKPSKPRTNCPICNGFGTLHLAAGVPTNFVVYRDSEHEELPAIGVQPVAKTDWRAPQNRGPPTLSA